MKQSRTKVEVIEETDDEKITLEKIILIELKNVIEHEENNVRFSQIEVQKYKEKYDNLRNTFRLDEPVKEWSRRELLFWIYHKGLVLLSGLVCFWDHCCHDDHL